MNNPILKYLLLPFSAVYGVIVYMRNKLYDLEILPSEEFDLPVISVGNITVGGTGKTPHTEYLVELLKHDFRVAVLSRGYKRKTRGFILAGESDNAASIGDEPYQMYRKFPDILVAVDEKRRRGINKLTALKNKPDVVILDDAFQHRSVNPGLSILLTDYNRPASKDFLLPAGRLREPFSSRKRANLILVTKCPGMLKAIDMRVIVKRMDLKDYQHLFFTRLSASDPKPVFNEKIQWSGTFTASRPMIIMVAGIAAPRTFKPFVRKLSTNIHELTYGDHHDYTETDIEKILSEYRAARGDEKYILTTEKDSVKWLPFRQLFKEAADRVFYIPAGIEFLNKDSAEFNTYIKNYVRSNKKSSSIYSD